MQDSVVLLTLSILHRKYPFRANFTQKFKIVSLSWSLVAGLIRICRHQWDVHFYRFSPWILFFGLNLVQKIKIVSLSRNSVPRLIQTCRIQYWCALFGPEIQNCLFKVTFSIVDFPLLYKGRGLSLWNFWKKSGGTDFSHKKRGIGKMGALF